MRKRRTFDEEPRPRELGATGKETAGERTLAGEAVRLQELIGNATTTEVIARSALQRDTATEAVPAKGGADKASGIVMTMAGIGTFPLESLNLGGTSQPPPSRREEKEEQQPKPTELVASKKSDDLSAKLQHHAAQGRPISEVVVVMSKDGKHYLTITLKNVHISSFTMGGTEQAYDTFSLVFDEIEQQFHGADDGK